MPSGPRLHEMKKRASAAMKIAALRIPSYIGRRILYQLCCVLLTLPLLALPMGEAGLAPAPILNPLYTDLVPLGSSLQSLLADEFYAPQCVAPARHLLGPLTSRAFTFKLEAGLRLNSGSLGALASDAPDSPHGRSPPSS